MHLIYELLHQDTNKLNNAKELSILFKVFLQTRTQVFTLNKTSHSPGLN